MSRCSAPLACSSSPLRPSVHYPSISLVDIMNIQTFPLYVRPDRRVSFEVRLELYGANARRIVSPPCLSPSHPTTPLKQVLGVTFAKLRRRKEAASLFPSVVMASEGRGSRRFHLMIVPNTKRHPNDANTDQLPILR